MSVRKSLHVTAQPFGHPMAQAMGRFVRTDMADGATSGEHVVEVLGSRIQFSYEPTSGVLTITAPHSSDLPPTYTENWLAEPLRILFGQLIFPRLVARNLGGGRTHVFIRSSPGLVREAEWAALWGGDALGTGKNEFWLLYAQLLTFIASARDKDGGPNFEANKITHLYQEIIQAAEGSRWVWALTFASSIEALVQMLTPKDQKRRDADLDEIDRFVSHINSWDGSSSLKEAAIRAARRASEITTAYMMRELHKAKVITKEQLDAWSEIRNSVMHGSLVSPYSTEEEDRKLLALASMVHNLTSEVVRRFSVAQQAPQH